MSNGKSTFNYIFNNIVALAFALALLFVAHQSVSGYNWAVNNIAVGNLMHIWTYPNLTYAQKSEIKNKMDYRYVHFLKQNTPENAVIWMPSNSMIHPKNRKSPFSSASWGIDNKAWAYYYLYPRKLVYDNNPQKRKQVDYVAIVNGRGYERLPYRVGQKTKHSVLPMHR